MYLNNLEEKLGKEFSIEDFWKLARKIDDWELTYYDWNYDEYDPRSENLSSLKEYEALSEIKKLREENHPDHEITFFYSGISRYFDNGKRVSVRFNKKLRKKHDSKENSFANNGNKILRKLYGVEMYYSDCLSYFAKEYEDNKELQSLFEFLDGKVEKKLKDEKVDDIVFLKRFLE